MSCHEGVSCNACSRPSFRGKRYKCLICFDYDLCERCYEEGVTDTAHKTEHAVQCILTQVDLELYYGAEDAKQVQSFTCPMCATMGFTLTGLREHLTSEHTETEMHVVCPVCAATPGGNPNNVTGDLAAHLALEHSRNQDVPDDQSPSRRLQRVPLMGARGSFGSFFPGRRPLRPLPPAAMSTGARRASVLLEPRGSATEVQQLRTRLQAARQQMQTAFRAQDRPRLRDPLPAATSVPPPLARFQEPVAVDVKPILVQPPPPDDPRFLLTACAEPGLGDSKQREIEVERADRSLFAQELLLNTLEAQAQADDEEHCEPKGDAAAMRGVEEAPTTGPKPNATASLQPTAAAITGMTATTSCGRTDAASSIPAAASLGHTQATSGDLTAPSSPGAAVAPILEPCAATTGP
ncbi:E3 ubiquitin-protein ligase KCMF1-like [Haemaphysalis longicornis]